MVNFKKEIFPEIEESDPELDHPGDIDYLGKVGNKYFGIQIKPITANANFGNYKITERMSSSFQDFEEKYGGKVFVIFSTRSGDKKVIKNKEIIEEIKDEITASFSEEEVEDYGDLISKYYHKAEKAAIRNLTLDEGLRLDGRETTQIRPIWCEVDYLPSTHGSAIFTRGETQALATVTLGTSREANKIDMPSFEGEETFYLHGGA